LRQKEEKSQINFEKQAGQIKSLKQENEEHKKQVSACVTALTALTTCSSLHSGWLAFAMFCVFPSILMTCWRYQERTKAAEAHRKELEAAQEVRVRCATVPFRARSTSLELVEEFASMPEPWQNSQTPYHRV